MNLGTFSLSLAVKDLAVSRSFDEAIGFTKIDGDETSWPMLANGDAKFGLFHGMFDSNIVTYNPPDARHIERAINDASDQPIVDTAGDAGPAHFLVLDPDGNTVMFDQHTNQPSRRPQPPAPNPLDIDPAGVDAQTHSSISARTSERSRHEAAQYRDHRR